MHGYIDVEKGIYRLNGELAGQKAEAVCRSSSDFSSGGNSFSDILVEDKSLVLVHPWYQGFGDDYRYFVCREIYKDIECSDEFDGIFSMDYIDNVDALIRTHRGNKIIFEEKELMKDRNRLSVLKNKLGGTSGVYFIPTKTRSPTPSECSWEEAADFIRKFGDDAYLAGGYFWGDGKDLSLGGCLGYTYAQLKENGIRPKIIMKCCFQ